MADEEQLRRLKEQGVEAWNAWRRQTTEHRGPETDEEIQAALQGFEAWDAWRQRTPGAHRGIDLREADLSGTDLRGANLHRAELALADLRTANLREANLARTNLVRARLFQAVLSGAVLSGADLSGANLLGADLSAANLRDADLSDATLSGADFNGAYFSETILSNVDLGGCMNLASIAHRGPSPIDIRTLQRSGHLPLAFLRGVGLPEKLIEYLPSILGEAIQFYSCFISYSTQDEEFARRLHADLQDKGVRCWFSPEDLKIGDKILDTLDEAIRLRDKVLLVVSEASIVSGWVEDEVTKTFAEERRRGVTVMFPVRLDDAVFATDKAWAVKLRDNRLIGDFRAWKDHDAYQRMLERLLRDLRVEVTDAATG